MFKVSKLSERLQRPKINLGLIFSRQKCMTWIFPQCMTALCTFNMCLCTWFITKGRVVRYPSIYIYGYALSKFKSPWTLNNFCSTNTTALHTNRHSVLLLNRTTACLSNKQLHFLATFSLSLLFFAVTRSKNPLDNLRDWTLNIANAMTLSINQGAALLWVPWHIYKLTSSSLRPLAHTYAQIGYCQYHRQ